MSDALITSLVTIAGVIMSLGYYPQAYRMWRNRSSMDVSAISYFIMGIGTTIWTFYGLYKSDISIIASFLLGAVGSWLVFFLTLYYRPKRASELH